MPTLDGMKRKVFFSLLAKWFSASPTWMGKMMTPLCCFFIWFLLFAVCLSSPPILCTASLNLYLFETVLLGALAVCSFRATWKICLSPQASLLFSHTGYQPGLQDPILTLQLLETQGYLNLVRLHVYDVISHGKLVGTVLFRKSKSPSLQIKFLFESTGVDFIVLHSLATWKLQWQQGWEVHAAACKCAYIL